MTNFNHYDLCVDLAQAKSTIYIEAPLGSVWRNKWLGYDSAPIADVLTIKPSYNKFNIDIYECKVTRSDFLNEIKTGKWKKYLNHCHRLYFATKKGIANKEEIPEGVGWIVMGDKGWKTIRAPKPREVEVPYQTLQSLLFYKQKKNRREVRREKIIKDYHMNKNIFKKIDSEVKQALEFYRINKYKKFY